MKKNIKFFLLVVLAGFLLSSCGTSKKTMEIIRASEQRVAEAEKAQLITKSIMLETEKEALKEHQKKTYLALKKVEAERDSLQKALTHVDSLQKAARIEAKRIVAEEDSIAKAAVEMGLGDLLDSGGPFQMTLSDNFRRDKTLPFTYELNDLYRFGNRLYADTKGGFYWVITSVKGVYALRQYKHIEGMKEAKQIFSCRITDINLDGPVVLTLDPNQQMWSSKKKPKPGFFGRTTTDRRPAYLIIHKK